VLRGGRLTAGQAKAHEQLWPSFGIELTAGESLEPRLLFGNGHPVFLEIGFGNGEALAQLAQRHHERNYLGIEVHRPGIGHLLLRLEELALDNVRLLRHDAREVLRRHIAPRSLSGVYLWFPDPWPKKRHHKRRLVQPEFAPLVARILVPGGLVHLATDWEPYAEQMLAVMNAAQGFENTAPGNGFSPSTEQRPVTKFEQRGRRLGHGVWDLVFRRR